jgi:hypothetical protein
VTLAVDVEDALRARGAVVKGRHWRFRCPVHADRRPSADFDPLKRAWICRACHAGGGVRDLARRLGLDATPPRLPRPRCRIPEPPPGISMDAWREPWLEVVEQARREDHRLAPHRPAWRRAEALRARSQAVAEARQLVSALGPDDPRAWQLAAHAARASTAAAQLEAELERDSRG